MKKHLSWLLPFTGIPVAYLVFVFGTAAVTTSKLDELAQGIVVFALLVAWFFGSMFLFIKGIIGAYGCFRSHRRSRGHFTKSERDELAVQNSYRNSREAARAVMANLVRNRTPPALEVWGIVLEPGEQVHLQITADYARFYGVNAAYVHTSGFFWGSPAFVLAGVGATMLGNRSRRRAAETASRRQWREVQRSPMFLTDRRIICQVSGQWLSFYYSAATACYPEPDNNSLVMEFHGIEPLLIGGSDAPLACVYVVWALHGAHGLASHPALQSLRG